MPGRSIKKKYPTSVEKRGDAYYKHGKHAKLLPVPCAVSENTLKFVEDALSARLLEISKVETISQVKYRVLNHILTRANSIE
jgi:hypothetical protein